MTLEELESILHEARWFEHLCEPLATNQFVQIRSLAPWTNLPTDDADVAEIANQMDWLPSSRDQDDPINGKSLEKRSEQLGKEEEHSRRSLDTIQESVGFFATFNGHPHESRGTCFHRSGAWSGFVRISGAYEILLAIVLLVFSDDRLWARAWLAGILQTRSMVGYLT